MARLVGKMLSFFLIFHLSPHLAQIALISIKYSQAYYSFVTLFLAYPTNSFFIYLITQVVNDIATIIFGIIVPSTQIFTFSFFSFLFLFLFGLLIARVLQILSIQGYLYLFHFYSIIVLYSFMVNSNYLYLHL